MEPVSMISTQTKIRFNYQDYLRLPDDRRCEIVDGDLRMTPSPLTRHQIVSLKLQTVLWKFISERNLGQLLYAPVDVVFSNEDIVQPDILFITKDRLGILTEKNVQGAPDLVIEILSPSNAEWDRENKRRLYEKHRVREYWIVDPEERSIEVLILAGNQFEALPTVADKSCIRSLILEDLSFPAEEIFNL